MARRSPGQIVRTLFTRLGLESDWYLILVAIGMGVLMGGVSMAFILPLRFIERWAEEHASDRSLMIIAVAIVPAIGAFLAGLVLQYVGTGGRAPGISSVIYAVHRERGRLPFTLAIRKWLASTCTIASGGSAGAEGPIVTIGATIGSYMARLLRINAQATTTLLGCGAAAGIASIFNAPLAGIFFCLEVLLRDFSLRTFTPIVIAAVISAVFTQTVLGDADPLFPVSAAFFAEGEFIDLLEMPNFFILGVVSGLIAPLFVRLLHITDGCFSRIKVHPVFKPAIGGALMGVLGVSYVLIAQPSDLLLPFYGNGYPEVAALLDPSTYFANVETRTPSASGPLLTMLLVIVALKMIATCITIGSGGSGGLFAPSLLIGAALGGAVGTVLSAFGLPMLNPAHYALVGMATMLASTTHAPLAGIFVAYEITRSEDIFLPLMFATVISTIVARLVSGESVYTWKLSRMGVHLGRMSDLTILRRIAVSDVPLAEAVLVHPYESAERLLELSEQHHISDFVVADDDERYRGMVVGGDLRMAMLEREAIPLLLVYELERVEIPTVTPDETLDIVLDKFSRHDVHGLPVLDPRNEGTVLGLITRDRLMRRYQEALAEG